MVFKLIRVDVEEPFKIQLQVGNHVIGRGKFLHNDENDKRVSRNHAELEVTDESVTLKALHQNPCFYIKTNTVDTEILQQNNIVSLKNGDKFGLIPDNYWYQVIHCSEPDNPQDTATACINVNQKDENGIKSSEQNNGTSDSNTEDETINVPKSEALEHSNRSDSPSIINLEEPNGTHGENTQAYDPAPCTPNKRAHDSSDSSPVDVKKVKTEPATLDMQDAQPGPSNDQAADPDSKDQKPNIAAPVSPPQPPALKRERCMYGANCYRRNAEHKAQFSHPENGDWGAGERGVCPFGRACRKADLRHWQAHEHPPGVNPPAPNVRRPGQRRNRNRTSGSNDNEDSSRVKRRRKKSSESDEDSEESAGTDLIVTGKRVRKTVKRDAWIDTPSDEDEDPYKTDESDEWQPSSDIRGRKGFSQNF